MRYQGRITDWNDDKGFGFVLPNGGGTRAFVHIKAFPNPRRRPTNGDLINYEIGADPMGRSRAVRVRFDGHRSAELAPGARPDRSTGFSVSYLVAFCVGLFVLVAINRLPIVVPFAYAVVSVLTYIAYAFDKAAALNNRWRTQESTLIVLGLLCGWPGGVLAQRMFRHKTVKEDFQLAFWVSVFLNTAVLGLVAYPSALSLLDRL